MPSAGKASEQFDSSHISRERIGLPRLPSRVAIGLILTACVQLGLLLWVIGRTAPQTALETTFFASPGLGWLYGKMDLASARSLSVIWTSGGIMAIALAARKLFQSDWVGLGVGVALVLDPSNLVFGQYATGHAAAFALQGTALYMFLSQTQLRWPAGILLGLAAMLDPWSALWGVAFLFLVLLRGHIYAAPQHIIHAFGPTLLLPLFGAVFGAWAQGLGCIERVDALFLVTSLQFGDTVALGHPLIWIFGMIGLAVYGLGSCVRILTNFRISRQPGRLQMRLDHPLPSNQARFLWLFWLWLLAPPLMVIPLLAMAVAAGVRDMARDAKGFGIGTAAVMLVSCVIVTIRVWGLIDGSSLQSLNDLQGFLPWHSASPCVPFTP